MQTGIPGTPDGPPIPAGSVQLDFYEPGGPTVRVEPATGRTRAELVRTAIADLQGMLDGGLFRLLDEG